ncbi:hypothetical protein SAMN06265338_10962 [Rhodoblastus acidophilus]|uniref:HEAT repeat domain-containing protein n=1 Tax=Rhodoblastus acidophilus TaxID=1074 RepID=A0A212RZ36_RHOAC|nr:hypothetical protein [Rhodoblastus acidophilus]SNB78117.1 hypothetical protein SAMN06265338_10962 [Rhodoblastus acidophilus]
MRHCITMTLAALLVLPAPEARSGAAPPAATAAALQKYSPTTQTLAWMFHYAEAPEPAKTPYAFLTLSKAGSLRDPEQAGVYLGFLAGVLNREGAHADKLLVQLTILPHEDQWILVRALAYSGLSDWKDLMRRLERHIPGRSGMIAAYLDGSSPVLNEIELEDAKPSNWDKMKDLVTFSTPEQPPHKPTFESNSDLLDTLWGFYFATGDVIPIARLVALLPWSKDRESVAKLTIGNMAAYTLAENASRSAALLAMLKAMEKKQPEEVAPVLKEVVRAADTVDTGYLRKQAVASIEELKLRGPNSSRNMAMWGQVGEGALSLGCLGAALTGAGAAIGIPCVVGGALTSAGLKAVAQP